MCSTTFCIYNHLVILPFLDIYMVSDFMYVWF